jgi:uncharacterized protein (TIGR02231 family)
MKKTILFICTFVLCITTSTIGQELIQSKINKAIVFTSGAQIERVQKVKLKQGENTVSFINLERGINQQTIQVYGNDKVTIVSTDFRRKVREDEFLPKQVLFLNDSLKRLDKKQNSNWKERDNLANEKNMILTNKTVQGKEGFDIEDLMDLADYYRRKLNEIDELLYENSIESNKITEDKRKINEILTKTGFAGNMGNIEIKIIANAPLAIDLKLTYIVNNVSWTPFYDIKSKGIESPLKVDLKATINQNTGVNWDGVQLVLSTSTPLNYGVIPKVHPWTLYFRNEYQKKSSGYRTQESPEYQSRTLSKASYYMETVSSELVDDKSVTLSDFTKTTENMTNREYSISLPYNISGNKGKAVVELENYEMKSDYVYYTVPKFDKNVYLLANVDDWEQYNLLPGMANIFLEGTYVGNSFIDPSEVHDTLSLLLGKDQDIVVERKKIKDYCKKSVFGGLKTTELGLEVLVKNKKNKAINIIVEDQIPISSIEEIEIKLLDKSNADIDEATGKLTWKYDIKAGESQKLTIRYEVKYPNKKVIGNL